MDHTTGHGAHSSQQTKRPRTGRTALTALLFLALTLLTPAADAATVDSVSTDAAPSGRVIGGTGATVADVSATGRWNSTVAVFATDAKGTRLCTGTLIAANWVATAAHCLATEQNAQATLSADNVFIAAGVTTTQNAGSNLVPAVSTHVHPGFSWSNASWDAALIELETTVLATPLALPDPSRPNTYSAGTADNVAGFGRSQAANSNSSGTLRTGRIEQVSAEACEAYNPGSGEYADCYLPGPNRQATCFGDSGGPLVRFDTTQGNTPVLWGITSTGPDPCDAATNGAFAPSYETRVTAVVDWFRSKLTGSSYAPKAPNARTTGTTTTTTGAQKAGTVSGGTGTSRAPSGGTGIGIFQTKITGKVSKRKATKLVLSSSFIGSTGQGTAEIVHCLRAKCKVTAKANVNYTAAGSAVKTQLKVAKCAKNTTVTLRLKVYDATGTLKDQASQRLARC